MSQAVSRTELRDPALDSGAELHQGALRPKGSKHDNDVLDIERRRIHFCEENGRKHRSEPNLGKILDHAGEIVASTVAEQVHTFHSILEGLLDHHESKEGRLGEATRLLRHSLALILLFACRANLQSRVIYGFRVPIINVWKNGAGRSTISGPRGHVEHLNLNRSEKLLASTTIDGSSGLVYVRRLLNLFCIQNHSNDIAQIPLAACRAAGSSLSSSQGTNSQLSS